ncbi:hypothetical protein PC9H_006162 [Pleurotus ostreatus]|uniref:Uncharacterized protein n=1 Tax=Pleurotus ostreatus TaxID=5322 RepID=A0A8H7DR89_PLEOS|nr:uncharacterized protein PC9H_006162 [Pleurotus ostreatus]KAF7430455.1 hypothetical protein PC9H_006162 [Pleurotus ostreatus]
MADTAIREVTKGVWTFSRPFARFGLVPIGGRSTAIQLNDGGLWVLASTPLNEPTKAKLDELGPVKYIVSADAVHYLFLSEFKKAYPDAKLYAPKAAIERCNDKTLKFDGVWGGSDSDGKTFEFENEARNFIQHCYFSGFKNRDVAFFHADSKVMVEADLLFNLPATEQYSKSTSSGYVPSWGQINPWNWMHPKLVWQLGENKEEMKRDARTVAGWNFEKIIPCHGDVIENDGNKAWREAYKAFLD